MRRYTKDDVTRSYHQGSQGLPMVNVKVPYARDGGWSDFRKWEPDADPRFTEEWLEEHVSEDAQNEWWWAACEHESEYYEGWVQEILGARVEVYAEGRMGGWRVVRGLDDVEEWDAVALAKWRKVERIGRELASGIPAQALMLIYINTFEEWASDRLEDEPARDVPEMLAALR